MLNGAWSCDDSNLLAADFGTVGKLDDRTFRTPRASGQLVWCADAVHVEHPGKDFELAQVKAGGRSYSRENCLGRAGCPMYIDPCFLHRFDDGTNLFFGGFFLHCYEHRLFPVAASEAPVPGTGCCAWAFLSDANSSR